jgi:hypothetical protein
MITKENIQDLVMGLDNKILNRIKHSNKEYIVLFGHFFNIGGFLTLKLTNDYNRYKNVSKNVFIFGASSARFDIDKNVIERGRSYTEQEDKSLSQVAILGNTLATDLFGDADPLGKLIRVGNYNFEVIGVYEYLGGFATDDQQVFIPVTTLQKKIQGIDYLIYSIVQLIDNNISSPLIFSKSTILLFLFSSISKTILCFSRILSSTPGSKNTLACSSLISDSSSKTSPCIPSITFSSTKSTPKYKVSPTLK